MNTKTNTRIRPLAALCAPAAVALLLATAGQTAVAATPSAIRSVSLAATGGTPCGRVEIAPMETIPVGKSSVIRPQTAVKRILLGNPENAQAARPSTEAAKDDKDNKGAKQARQDDGRPGVAQVDVLLLSPNEIYLLGKTVGSTNVVLVDSAGGCTALDVTVAMDVTSVQGVLEMLLPDETGIKVSSAYDSLVLTGTVSDATKVDRAVEIASAYVRDGAGDNGRNVRVLNMLTVGAPQQVMLEVKVAEVSKAVLDRFGIDFTRAYASGDGTMIRFLSGIFGGRSAVGGQVSGTALGTRIGGGIVDSLSNSSATSALTAPLGNATIGGDSTTIPLAGGSNSTMLSVDALKSDGLIKILAEPTVMAISGQEGSFLAGGKIFIPVAQGDSGSRTVTLEEKEFGVSVKFTPTVLDGGRINLAVRPEVSELNREGVGISAPGISGLAVLPSFTTRRAFTTVQLQDGQSFAIGGLIKNNTTTNIRAFPFLGELPVLGALFRSTEFQTDRTELVFVITPRLVKPLPADYALPTDNYIEPSRADVMLHGRLEGSAPASGERARANPGSTDPARGGFETK